MDNINNKQYLELIKGAEIIEKDGFGLKVLDTKKGEMIKLFRRKRLLSTALLKPYAVRFVDHAKQLTALNIPTITINQLAWCASIKRHVVVYQRLEGELLRDVLTALPSDNETPYREFGAFVAELHNKGVYFRSAHLKNILVLANEQFGLIDISDMRIKRGSLGISLRKRNFKHILRYPQDKALVCHHINAFTNGYINASTLNEKNSQEIKQTIEALLS